MYDSKSQNNDVIVIQLSISTQAQIHERERSITIINGDHAETCGFTHLTPAAFLVKIQQLANRVGSYMYGKPDIEGKSRQKEIRSRIRESRHHFIHIFSMPLSHKGVKSMESLKLITRFGALCLLLLLLFLFSYRFSFNQFYLSRKCLKNSFSFFLSF